MGTKASRRLAQEDPAVALEGPGDYPPAEIVVGARYLHDYVIEVSFADGFTREVDLAQDLNGTLLEPLRDLKLFRRVRVHPGYGTVVWPSGADLAPEFLRYGPDRPDCPCSAHEAARRHAAESLSE